MKRLREVAVRMRPMAPKGADGAGAAGMPPEGPPAMETGPTAHATAHDAARHAPQDAPPTGAGSASAPETGPGGHGFSRRNTEAPLPVRAPFMPTSRDLAGRGLRDAPAAPPPPARRQSVPRRQIWDLDGGADPAEPRPSYPLPPTPSRPLPPEAAPSRPLSGPLPPEPPRAEHPRAEHPRAEHPRSEPRRPEPPMSGPSTSTPSIPEPPMSEPRWSRSPSPPPAAADMPPRPVSRPMSRPIFPEAEPGGADDMASRARRALAAAPMAEAPGAPETGGAKTRLLGFHAPDLAADPISAVAQKSAHEVLFPAGWLVVVDGPGRGAFFAVGDSVSSIGRGADQGICLNFGDASISRQNHVAIAYDAEQNRFFLGHGNKSNIVRRNGMPVLSTEEIVNGDVIRIGKTSLRFVALCGPDFTWDHGAEADGYAHD